MSRPLINEEEAESCKCTPSSPCTSSSNCINRAILVECSPKNCPAGTNCQNQRIYNNSIAPSEIFHTGNRGWGLKSTAPLSSGDFVVEYIGEVVDMATVQERLKKQQEVYNYYFLTLGRNCIIDASQKSNCARFINHSCDPNCETQKWTVNGETRIGIFAIKDIPSGTELTFDYRLDSLGNEKKACLCGASNCSGYIGERPKQDRISNGSVVSLGVGLSKGRKKHRMSTSKSPALKKDKKTSEDKEEQPLVMATPKKRKSTQDKKSLSKPSEKKQLSKEKTPLINQTKKGSLSKSTPHSSKKRPLPLTNTLKKSSLSSNPSEKTPLINTPSLPLPPPSPLSPSLPTQQGVIVREKKRKRSHSTTSSNYSNNSKVKHSEDPYDDDCFICQEGGELILCDYNDCRKVYHMSCLGLEELPADDFICPRHHCTACEREGKDSGDGKAEFQCFVCPRSFCHEHYSGNLQLTDAASFRCVSGNCSQR